MDFGVITGSVSLVEVIFRFAKWLKGLGETDIIYALFDSDGNRVEGNEEIEIQKHQDKGNQSSWWFSVKEIDGYTFIRAPIVESGISEIIGTVSGEKNPDARYWRYIANPLPGRIYGGSEPNAKVSFYVIGYKPKNLLKKFK